MHDSPVQKSAHPVQELSLSRLPAELIAHVTYYVSYSDVCRVMETNTNNYNAIQQYGKNKMKLEALGLTPFSNCHMLEGSDGFTKYQFKGYNSLEISGEEKMKKIVDKCASIETMRLPKLDLSIELYNYLMKSRCKIKMCFMLSDNMLISVEQLLRLCQKFDCLNFSCLLFDPAIWNDDVLVKILPNSTINRISAGFSGAVDLIGSVNFPMPITDRTLNALFDGNVIQNQFNIRGVYNRITIKGIVKALKVLLEKGVNTHWNLGHLQPDQVDDAERYFGKDGELGEPYYITNLTNHYYVVSGLKGVDFQVWFDVASN